MTVANRNADSRPAETRERIVSVALRLFAEHGFKGVSVRDISAAAQVNIAAISYHFGSKQGLYRTIFETVLDEDEERFSEQIANVGTLLDRGGVNPITLAAAVEILAAGLIGRISTYEHARWFSVLLARELAFPGEFFDLLYRRRAEPILGMMTRVVAAALSLPADSEEARLIANIVYGQVANLVFSRPILWRQLGWEGYTPERIGLLTRHVADLICRAIGLSGPIDSPTEKVSE